MLFTLRKVRQLVVVPLVVRENVKIIALKDDKT